MRLDFLEGRPFTFFSHACPVCWGALNEMGSRVGVFFVGRILGGVTCYIIYIMLYNRNLAKFLVSGATLRWGSTAVNRSYRTFIFLRHFTFLCFNYILGLYYLCIVSTLVLFSIHSIIFIFCANYRNIIFYHFTIILS